MGWPDKRLACRLGVAGFEVVGAVPDTGAWRQRSPAELAETRESFVPPKELLASNDRWTSQQVRTFSQRFTQAWPLRSG